MSVVHCFPNCIAILSLRYFVRLCFIQKDLSSFWIDLSWWLSIHPFSSAYHRGSGLHKRHPNQPHKSQISTVPAPPERLCLVFWKDENPSSRVVLINRDWSCRLLQTGWQKTCMQHYLCSPLPWLLVRCILWCWDFVLPAAEPVSLTWLFSCEHMISKSSKATFLANKKAIFCFLKRRFI